MKKAISGLVLVGGVSNAWAQTSGEAARPAGFQVGYVVGIAIFVYVVARMLGFGKKKPS